jgi:DNA repair protein RadC
MFKMSITTIPPSSSHSKNQIFGLLALQPRERLIDQGARALTDEELLSVMLGSGTKHHSVFSIAKQILPIVDRRGIDLGLADLVEIKGIGHSKALMILAALEFVRRRIRPDGTQIKSPTDILPLVSHLIERDQEHLLTITLSGAHEVLQVRTVSIGLLTSCPVHPREIFVGPIMDRAYSLILVHNHPSGDPAPSSQDFAVTQRIEQAGSMLGIALIDHLIVARRGYYSFKQQGHISQG